MKKRFILSLSLLLLLLVGCGGNDTAAPTIVVPTSISSGSDTGGIPLDDDGTPVASNPTATPFATSTSEAAATPTSPPSQPTPTLANTPTATPDPLAGLPIVELATGQLPSISRDLLFRTANDQLKIWRTDGTVETVADFVYSVQVTANGRFAAIRQRQALGELFELQVVDLVSGEVQRLEGNLPEGGQAISENGKWVVYVDADRDGPQQVYLYPLRQSDPPRLIHTCVERCFVEIAWHPSNEFFTFTDREALWLYNLSASDPEILLQSESGEGFENNFIYAGSSWGRNGRFFLLWRGFLEGADRAIFDVPTGTLEPIGGSFAYVGPHRPSVTWMQDDRLLRTSSREDAVPTIALLRFNPDAEDKLVVEESLALSDTEGVIVSDSIHLENGRFAYALTNPTNPSQSGLYLLISLTEEPEQLVLLPNEPFPPTIRWSPDGTGAMIVTDRYTFYAPIEGETLIDLNNQLGLNLRDLHWLPPSP